MNAEPVVEARNVSFAYPDGSTVLNGIDFAVQRGEFVAIIGQNGAGKSTLLKNLTGLLRPTVGDVVICGVNTRETSVSRMASKVGFVLQNPDRQLFAKSVEQEILFGPRNLHVAEEEIRERLEWALDVTGLQALRSEFPPALSAADRSKVVIASVIAMQPEIVIFDEPTMGQDKRGRHQIMALAKDLQAKGRTIILVTHDMSLVARYAERAIVMCEGRILMNGQVTEVFSDAVKLRRAHVMPPQITELGRRVNERLGEREVYVTVNSLVERLDAAYSQG